MTSIVLERAETLRTTGASIGMQSNGWQALNQLGVGLKLRQAAIPVLRYIYLLMILNNSTEIHIDIYIYQSTYQLIDVYF